MTARAYAILGLAPDASMAAVKAAYRQLAKALHPDRVGADADAAERFRAVTEAYRLIVDEAARKATLKTAFWRGARVRVRAPRRGADLHASVTLTLAEAVGGAVKSIALGDGRTQSARVPAGVAPGDVLRLAGLGEPGRDGGPAGDALVAVSIAPDPVFRLEGRDARAELRLPPRRLRLGGEETAPTPQGPVRVMIPAGARPGQILRVRGKGLPARDRHRAGDLYLALSAQPVAEPAPSPARDEAARWSQPTAL